MDVKQRNRVQDDVRENMQIELFDLNPYEGRSNKYIPDAWYLDESGVKYDIEFKSMISSRGEFSSNRIFTHRKMEDWKTVSGGFVFSRYNFIGDDIYFLDHVYCSVSQLHPWFEDVKSRLDENYSVWNKIKKQVTCTEHEMCHMEKMLFRGTSLNDPRLRPKDLVRWGVLIDRNRPAEHLRELVSRYAKNELFEKPVNNNTLERFF